MNAKVLLVLPAVTLVGETVMVPDPLLATTTTKLAVIVRLWPLPLDALKVHGLEVVVAHVFPDPL